MGKSVIINADDFGHCKAVSYGIIEAFNTGVVSSTTALTVSPMFKASMELAKQLAPDLPVGLHLTLTLKGAKPVTSSSETTLVNTAGYFHTQDELIEKLNRKEIDLDEVATEWEAQYLKFLESGKKPTHIDSHHHVHRLDGLFEVAQNLALKHNLPMRNIDRTTDVRTPDKTYGAFYAEGVTKAVLLDVFEQIAKGGELVSEIVVHPAYFDNELQRLTSYALPRITELEILTDDAIKRAIEKHELVLTDFHQI